MKTEKEAVWPGTSSPSRRGGLARRISRRDGKAGGRCVLAAVLVWLATGAGAGAQNTFTNIGTGFWTDGASWQDGAAPAAGGLIDYSIVFNNPALDWSTNNLAGTNFLLNQLVFDGAANVNLTNAVARNLVFIANSGAALPQLVQNTAATNTLYSGLILSNTLVVTGPGAGLLNINSNVAGAGGLIMNGASFRLALNRANTYTGGTLLSNGVIQLGHSNALGNPTGPYLIQVFDNAALNLNAFDLANSLSQSKTVFISGMGLGPTTGAVFNGGSGLTGKGLRHLQLGADSAIGQTGGNRFDIVGNVAAGGHTLYKVGNNTVFLGGSANLSNLAALVINGGTFGLQGASNLLYAGPTPIQIYTGGTLAVWGPLTFTNAIDMRGGELEANGNGMATWNGPIALNGASNLFDGFTGYRGFYLNVGGDISGTGKLVKIGANLLDLSGNNTYSGGTVITNGPLQFSTVASVPAAGLITLGPVGLAQFAFTNMQSVLDRVDATNSTGTIGVTPFNINDNLDFNVLGLSNVTLGAYDTVQFNGTLTPFGTTYQLGGGRGTLVITNGTTLTNLGPGGATAAAVLIGMSGGSQSGTVLLNGANTYTGGTLLYSNNTLSIASEAAIGGPGSLLTFSGGTLQVRGTALNNLNSLVVNWTNQPAVQGGFNGGLDINNNGNTFTVNSNLSGPGSLTKLGYGTLILATTNNTMAGSLNIREGVLRIGHALALAVGSNVVFNGAAMQLATTNTSRAAAGANGNSRRIILNGTGVDNDGALRITSGAVTNYASIRLASAARINADAGVTFVQAGIVSNFGFAVTFGGFGNFISSNRIGGTGGLIKDGAGTLTLINQGAKTNDYGNTTVAAGTLKLDFNLSRASTTSLITNSSVLALGSSSFSITTGGTLNILGPAGVSVVEQWFSGLAIGAGNNRITVSNNAGTVFLNLSNITRAVGGGSLDLLLPGGNGQITSAQSNNYAGLLGQTVDFGGANVLATVGRADWAMATNFGGATNKIVAYAGYTDFVTATPVSDNSNANLRITSGSSGDVTFGSWTTTVNSLLVNDAAARALDLQQTNVLRLGQTGGLLLTPGSGGLTLGTNVNDGALTAGGADGTDGELVFINHSANALTVNSMITRNAGGNVDVTVNGNGVVNFAGDIVTTNDLYVNSGTVNVSGTNILRSFNVRGGALNIAASSSTEVPTAVNGGGRSTVDGGSVLNVNGSLLLRSNLQVGVTAGSRAVMNIGGSANVVLTNTRDALQIGVGGAGAVYQTGGVVTVGAIGTASDNMFYLGNGGYGYYRITNGLLDVRRFAIGTGANGPGVFDQFDGTVNIREYIIHRGDAAAAVNVFGGQMSAGSGADVVLNFDAAGYGLINVGGLGMNARADFAGATSRRLIINQTVVGGTGVVNVLGGGTLIANQILSLTSGVSVLNINGGTIAAGDGTTFGGSFLGDLSAAFIYSNGATFDSGTNAITIAQPLMAVGGFGLTNLAIANGGSGYIGAPVVQISGGSGTGATAVALINPVTGVLTNIVITSAGSGYLSNDALYIKLVGGGAIQAAQLGAFTFGQNTGAGGVTKNGIGTLTLLATNTYAGPTVINAGTLLLGTTNSAGSGTINLANPATAIGPTYALDQAFVNWLDGRSAGVITGAVVLGSDSASNLVFTSPNMANAFLGSAAPGGAAYSGAATWSDSTMRLGGGGGLLVFQPEIGGATNVLIGAVGGNPLSVTRLGSNSFSGGLTLVSGALWADSDFNFGAAGVGITFSGGTLRTTVNGLLIDTNRPITLSPGASGTFAPDAGTELHLGNTVSGAGSLIMGGPGTMWLDGPANTYGGGTILNGGTLSIDSEDNIGGIGSALTFSGGTLRVRGLGLTSLDNLTVNWASFNGGLDINNNGNTFVITNDLDGVLLTKSGQGLLVLGGDNSSASLTSLVVQAGAVLITNGSSLATLTNQVQSGGAIWLGSNIVTAGQPITLNGLGALGDDGALRNIGGINTNAGPITLASNARINADPGSTLHLSGPVSNLTRALTIGAFGDVVSSGGIYGTGGLTKDRAGTLTLQGYVTNAYGNTLIEAGTLRLDYGVGSVASDLVATSSVLTLGTASFSSSTGGTLVVNGPASGAITQSFARLVVNPGNNALVAQNNGGDLFINLDGIARAVGGGMLDLTLPGGAGEITTTLSNNYAGLLGFGVGSTVGTNGIFTIDRTDWAMATNFGAGIHKITNYTGYVDVGGGGIIGNDSNSNVRLTDGGSGDILLGAAVTSIHSLAATSAAARTIDLAGQTLRMGQTAGILLTPTSGGLTFGTNVNDGILTAGGDADTAGELVLINYSSTALTVNSAITSNGLGAVTVTVGGNGAVDLAGNNTYNQTFVNGGYVTFTGTNAVTGPAPLTVRGGVVTLAPTSTNTFEGGTVIVDGGGVFNVNGPMSSTTNIRVGVTAGSRAVMHIGTNLTLARSGTAEGLRIGVAGAGAVYQTGGVVTLSGIATNEYALGLGSGGYAYYRITNGELNVENRFSLGVAANSPAVFEQSGGTVTIGEWIIHRGDAPAVLNVFGGQFNAGNLQDIALCYDAVGYGLLNVGGGGVANLATAVNRSLNVGRQAGSTGIVNVLSGGTLIANRVYSSAATGVSLLNFDGGTLKAGAGTTLGPTFVSGLAGAYIYGGGATIDTDTNIVTVVTALQAPTAWGLTNIAVANGGSGYIGAPVVMISGGHGVGASAIAQVDLDPNSATFSQVTNILITSMGSGYLSNDTLNITLVGGGAILPAQLGAFTFGTNVLTGGLTKDGSGTLILAGTNNTYGGATVINAGALQIGNGGSVGGFGGGDVTDDGVLVFNHTNHLVFANNVNGSGSLVMLGSGQLDLTGNNSYAAGTVITNGFVLFAATNARPDVAQSISLDPGSMAGLSANDLNTDLVPFIGQDLGALGLVATNGTENSENFDFNAAGPGGARVFTNLSLGAGSNVTYTGVYAPYQLDGSNFWRLAAYRGATLTFSNAAAMGDGSAASTLEVNKGGGSLLGTVALRPGVANTYSGGTFLYAGILNITNDNALGAVPGSPATNITFVDTATMQFGDNLTLDANRAFSILAGTGTFDTAGNTVFIPGTIGGDGSMNKIGAGALVLDSNTDTVQFLTVNGGTLRLSNTLFTATGTRPTGAIIVGDTAADNGAVMIVDTGSVVRSSSTSNSAFTVGNLGIGNTLIITNGGQVYAGTTNYPGFWLGNQAASSNNAAIIIGANSLLTSVGRVLVGDDGSFNTMHILDGGTVSNANWFEVGRTATASNNLLVVSGAGALLTNTSQGIIVGEAGSGNSVIVTNGARVMTTGRFVVGYGSSGDSNAAFVGGPGTLLRAGSPIQVGTGGSFNVMTIGNGATVTGGTLFVVGAANTAQGNLVRITDTGTVVSIASEFRVGENSSNNTAMILTGAVVNVASWVQVGRQGAADGNLLLVSGEGSVLNANTANGMIIGNSGSDNAVIFTNSARASVLRLVLGWASTGTDNQALVGGAGTLLQIGAGGLWIGSNASDNAMVIGNGAIVSNLGLVSIGHTASAANNALLVTDAGSLLAAGGALTVGNTGSYNSLTVAGGGVRAGGLIQAGATAAANNNLIQVDGAGSVLSNTSSGLRVGNSGSNNRMIVTNGGLVNIVSFFSIGSAAGATNNALAVGGAGSVVTNLGNAYAGESASYNSIHIVNGGRMVSGTVRIGGNAGADSNLVTVAGAGSVLMSLGNVGVGWDSATVGNQLTVTNGGAVFVGGDLSNTVNSVMNTAGGTMWMAGHFDNLATNNQQNDFSGAFIFNGTSDASVRTQRVEIASVLKDTADMANTNLFFGTFQVGDSISGSNGFVQLADDRANTAGAGSELLAVSNLIVATINSVLDLNGKTVFAYNLHNTGTVQQAAAGIGRVDAVNAFTNFGNLYAGGGVLQFSNAFINALQPDAARGVILNNGTLTNFVTGGVLTNYGTIAGSGLVNPVIGNEGIIAATNLGAGGTLVLAGGFTNNGAGAINAGLLAALGGDGHLQVAQSFTNAGRILMNNDSAAVTVAEASSNLFNAGIIEGRGVVNAFVDNAGVISNGVGGVLTFNLAVNNRSGGWIGAYDGSRIAFNSAMTNAGTLKAGNGSQFEFNNGLTLDGAGSLVLDPSTTIITGSLILGPSGILSLATTNDVIILRGDFVNGSTNKSLFSTHGGTMVVGSPGAVTNTFEVAGTNLGTNFAGFNNNFALGVLSVTNHVRFVDNIDNVTGLASAASNEVLYVDVLRLSEGATMTISMLTIYVGLEFVDAAGNVYRGQNTYDFNNNPGLIGVSFDPNGGWLVIIPEPSTGALLVAGAAALACWRRRRTKKLPA